MILMKFSSYCYFAFILEMSELVVILSPFPSLHAFGVDLILKLYFFCSPKDMAEVMGRTVMFHRLIMLLVTWYCFLKPVAIDFNS
jgi:hypothetical protein